MYDTTYKCIYAESDIFTEDEKTELTLAEQHFILNCLYRNDLLYIFDLDDIENFNYSIIDILYDKLKENEFILSCIKKLADNETNNKIGLQLLYSYDYLYLMHPCVCEMLTTNCISEQNMTLLQEKVFQSES